MGCGYRDLDEEVVGVCVDGTDVELSNRVIKLISERTL